MHWHMRRGGRKEKLKTIDWKQFGRFLKMVLDLFGIITAEFKARAIGPDILEWVTTEGKDEFVEKSLKPLGDAYYAFQEKVREAETPKTIIGFIDLDAEPVPPPGKVVHTKNIKQGRVEVKYRVDEDELYADGHKVILWQLKKGFPEVDSRVFCVGIKMLGNRLLNLNAAFADWLYANPDYIPRKWQYKPMLLFLGTEWKNVSDSLRHEVCVRVLTRRPLLWESEDFWVSNNMAGAASAGITPQILEKLNL